MALPTLPSTNDGHIHRGVSWHQYPALGNTTTDHNRAVTLAKQVELIASQFSRLQGFAGDMFAANPNLLLMPYLKGVAFPTSQKLGGSLSDVGQVPYQWFAHTSWAAPIDNSAHLITAGGFNVNQMMADTTNDNHANTSTNAGTVATWWVWAGNDRLGNSVQYFNWKEMNSKYCGADVGHENTLHGYTNNPWRGLYYDSMGTTGIWGGFQGSGTAVHRNGSAYADANGAAYDYGTTAAWLQGDQAIADNPNLLIWANAFNPSSDISDPFYDVADHFHGILMENIFGPSNPTDYPAESKFGNFVNDTIKMQVTNGVVTGGKNVYVWAQEKANGSTWTTTTWNNYRRFAAAFYFFSNRGKLWFEFQRSTTGGTSVNIEADAEYGQDKQIYDLAMGAPLDTQTTFGGYAVGGQAGLYSRRFTSGLALINFSGSARTFTADRTYTLVNPPGTSSTTTITAGSGITVPAVAGNGTVTAQFFTTSSTPPPPQQSLQDRLTSSQQSTTTGSIEVGKAVIPPAVEVYTVGAQNFRATFEVGNFSEFTTSSGSQIVVQTGHAHQGTRAARCLVTTSGTSYAQKTMATPAQGFYGRTWFSVIAVPNGLWFVTQFITVGNNNQPSMRVDPSGNIIASLGPVSGSATANQSKTLYTLNPATDLGDYFRIEWFLDMSNAVTGRLHAWLYNATNGLLGSTGTDNGNTTGTPLTFTGVDYLQSNITQLRAGVCNSTPTTGEIWVDDVGYNVASLGKVGP